MAAHAVSVWLTICAVLLGSCCLAHEASDAFSLNTYFISTSSFSLVREDFANHIYNLTIPVTAVLPVIPLLQPKQAGMMHSVLNTKTFLQDLAVLSAAASPTGHFAKTGYAAQAQFAGACHDQLIQEIAKGPQAKAPNSLLFGIEASKAMAIFDILDVSQTPNEDAVVMKLRVVREPHLVSEFDPHPKQEVGTDNEHYHFHTGGDYLIDADALLAVVDGMQSAVSCDAASDHIESSCNTQRTAVLFLKGVAGVPGSACDAVQDCGSGSCCRPSSEVECLCGLPIGATCAADTDCCTRDCDGQCQPGSFEVCSVVVADPHFVGFDGTSYEVGSTSDAQGYVYNLISANDLQVNTIFDRAPGPDRWPYWGTWMRGYGIKFANVLQLEVAFKSEVQLEEKWVSTCNSTRSVLPTGGFQEIMTAKVNGKNASDYIESGDTLELGDGVTVHFPDAQQKHQGDVTDGPVMVVTTPILKMVIYLETEEHAHFDFSVNLLSLDVDMHGLLGQTVRWARNKTIKKVIEGEEKDYVVSGLMGTDFKYNLFGNAPLATTSKGRSMIVATKDSALSAASSRSALEYGNGFMKHV